MVESSKGQHEEFDDEEEVVTHKGKGEGKSREKNRSKHSETEQRRRSKINERFQLLRDLIPQNDQKRDKASFLLEVIEYIQFLKEKLIMYEGSYQGWSSEPRKLTPWKNEHVPTEGFSDPSQVMKNGSDHQNNVVVSPSMLPNSQNALESDMGSAMVYKTVDHLAGSATEAAPPNVQQTSIFDSIGRHGLPSQPFQESVSDAVNVDVLPQPMSWQQSGHTTACTVLNNTPNIQEEKSGSASISNSYSQGLLDTLTQALQSSGVDLSKTSISVQIDVANRTNSGLASMPSSSKDHVNRSLNNQVTANSQAISANDKFEQAHKRLRVE